MTQTLTDLHGAIASYKMPTHAKELIGSGEVLVLCGTTSAGKNTIINYLTEHKGYKHVTSHTTRQPRENQSVLEKNGGEYWFVDTAKMLELVKDKGFIEVKAVHGETCYGTSIKAVDTVINTGKHPVMEVDVQGALELTEAVPNLRPLFVLPPSYEVWMQRLSERGGLSENDRARRFLSASMEIQTALDHPAFILVVNKEVEITAEKIVKGVDTSHKAQQANRELAESLLETIKKI